MVSVTPQRLKGKDRWVLADRYVYVLAAIPVFVLLRNTNPLYSPVGYLDPWIYYSFFNNFSAFKGHLFPGTYYGSRLSWIVPGTIVYHAFPPLVANAVLHLAVFYSAIFSVFYTLKQTIGRRTALLGSLMMGFHPYLWLATGGDYPDGAGLAYYSMAFAAITCALKRPHARASLFWAGAAYASSVYCNIFLLYLAPPLLVYYLALHERRNGMGVAHLLAFACWFATGGLAVTAILAAVNKIVEGSFFFYRPSIFLALASIGKRSAYMVKDYSWLSRAYWLYLNVAAVAASAACLISRQVGRHRAEGNAAAVFSFDFLLVAGIMVWVQLRGEPAIQLMYYASYMIPPAFLALGSQLRFLSKWSARGFLVLVGLSGGLLALGWCEPGLRMIQSFRSVNGLTVLAIAAGGLCVTGIVSSRVWSVGVGAAALIGVELFITSPGGSPNQAMHAFLRITRAMKLIEAERRDGLVRFWFNAHEPLGPEYHSLNSTYLWGYTQISPEFPNLPDEVVFLAGMLVVVPSVSPNSGAVAAADFHRPGLHLKMLPQRRIESGGQRYFLNLLRVEPDSQASASQAVILGARDQGEHLRDAFWQNCGALQSFRRFGSVGAVPLRLRIEPHLPRNSLAAALKQKKAWT